MITNTSASGAPGATFEQLGRLAIWFAPDRTGFTLDHARRSEHQATADSLLIYIGLITSAFAVLYWLTSLAIGFTIGAFLMMVSFFMLISNLLMFRFTGSFRLSANLYLGTCALIAILGCSFFTGGLHSPVTPWFMLIPIVGVLLLGLGLDALLWFILCCAITLAYGVAGMLGYAFPQAYNLELANLFITICASGLVMIAFAIAVTFDRNRNLAMKKVREQNEALKTAREQADAATQAKSDFLANMSHEIRTPMNAVIGFAHLCLNLELSARSRDYVQKISSAATSLLGIINDILDFSKIEAGKLEIESIPFNMNTLLEQMTNLFSLKAREKGVELVIETRSPVPDQLQGDPLRLGQVLTNLLGNAVKFTERGKISLAIETASISADAAALRFEVRDSGLGMTPEQQEKLFAAFSQADTSTTRKYGGTGLGLSISRQLVEIMGGTLSVESKAGEGSCFRFTLDFKIPASAPPPIAHPQIAPPSLAGSRILLVDDNDFNRQVGRELIETTGAVVDTADNGERALAAIAAQAYDLVLMDIQMPVMDGYAAARLIRERRLDLPVIALTAHALSEEKTRSMAVGMNDMLSKPILPGHLYAMLARWLPDKGAVTPAEPKSCAQPKSAVLADTSPNSQHEGFDLSVALSRVNGDHKMLERFLRLFRERNADSVEEIGAALAQQDNPAAHRLAHALKGGAGTIGMTGLQTAAARMEAMLSSPQQHGITRHGEDFAALESAWAQAMKTLNALLDTPSPGMNDAVNPEN